MLPDQLHHRQPRELSARRERSEIGADAVAKRFVYLTAGSCGACRFGQYHQSYELALRNTGLEAFRMFLLAQDQTGPGLGEGDGFDLGLPTTLGCLWAIFCTDLVQDLEYQVRPYEVVPGQTDAVVRESIEYLYQAFRNRPRHGPWRSLAWHLSTPHFARAMRDVRRKFAAIEVDRLRVKPMVKITGEFYLQTVEGDPNYNIHRWLEREGAEVYPAGVAVWMDYLLRLGLQRFEDYAGIERGARLKLGAGARGAGALPLGSTTACAGRWAVSPHELPDQYELRRLAAPYFHSRLDGGEGDMLVGKALWAHHQEEGPHDLRAVAVLVHAEHDEHRRDGGRRRQASRPALRAARDQGRRRGARAVALPDDPHRGQEARAARDGRDAGAHRAHAGRGARAI